MISQILKAGELNYPLLEKAAFILITTARRLHPYFQAHSIVVRTHLPLKKVLGSPTTLGRMISWSVELSEHDVRFEPRTTIKAQALADFLIESTASDDEPAVPSPAAQPRASPPLATVGPTPRTYSTTDYNSPEFTSWWLLKVDGSSGESGSGAGVVLRSPDGSIHEHSIALSFSASNNEAKYEAILAGLRAASTVKAHNFYILADSQLVVRQVKGEYAAKDPRIALYLKIAKELLTQFEEYRISQIPRALNARADALSRLGSTSAGGGPGPILVDTLEHPSIMKAPRAIMQTETPTEPCRIDPIILFLTQGVLPENTTEAKKLQRNARLMGDKRLPPRVASIQP